MDHFYCDEGPWIFSRSSRISSTKRQSLIVQALSHCREDVRLILIGRPDHPIVGERLMQQVEELHLSDRVTFLNFVSTEEKLRLYAQARAVLFCPLDEDYGYITLEAMAAHKAVLTCTDSGGPLEFVLDGQTGMVSPPRRRTSPAPWTRCGPRPRCASRWAKPPMRVYWKWTSRGNM